MFCCRLNNVCSTQVEFDIQDSCLKNISFQGGCPGNLRALAILAEGRPVAEIIQKLEGIPCGNRGTSCADQFARALKELAASHAAT